MILLKPNANESLDFNIDQNTLSHAYIICGPEGAGKRILAETIASAMVCDGSDKKPCMECLQCRKAEHKIHPDIIFVDKEPEKKEIYVDQIRSLKHDAFVFPNEAAKKVYVINNAGAMNTMAQNAMLKLLEEPPSHAAFILITDNPEWLLPTVRSRCVEISLIPQEDRQDKKISEPVNEFFEVICSDDKIHALKFYLSLEKLNKIELGDFIESAKELASKKLRESLTGQKGELSTDYLMHLLRLLEQIGSYLDVNVGTGHIAGLLCADLIDRK